MINVGILGATGSVGQRFIQQLQNHLWYKITELAASERSAGKSYREAVRWFLDEPMPKDVMDMIVKNCEPSELNCDLVFSGLDSSVAGEIEENFAARDFAVISNSKNHRFDADVPLLIPEVNADHIGIIDFQRRKRGYKKGFIATNPNCSTIGLAIALKPLQDAFGVKRVFVTTMQAISGAGYPGVPSLDILGNVIPFIDGEEVKIETETKKILGLLKDNNFEEAGMVLSAHCNRVHVQDGHTECVSVEFDCPPAVSGEELVSRVRDCLNNFSGEPQALNLPFAPERPIHVLAEQNRPQPRADKSTDKGMAVCIGRIRPCNIFHVRFTLLSHNTIRGAAGAAILNAELLYRKGYLGNL